MTSINDILKPKSRENINEELNKMSSFEFIYMIRRQEKNILSGLKIGFKKRILYLFIIKALIVFWKIVLITILWMTNLIVFGELPISIESISIIYEKIIEVIFYIYIPITLMLVISNILYSNWEDKFVLKKNRNFMKGYLKRIGVIREDGHRLITTWEGPDDI